MNRRLTIVFLALIAMAAFGQAAAQAPLLRDPAKLHLASLNAVVVDASANRPVYAKGANDVTPIASLTKLMTAIVTLDAAETQRWQRAANGVRAVWFKEVEGKGINGPKLAQEAESLIAKYSK